MRIVTPFALVMALAAPALAQQAGPRPQAQQPAAAAPAPARQDPVSQSYAALPESERMSIQTDLVWTGDYAGAVDGDFGPRAVAAVKAFQKTIRSKETGVLNPKERSQLSAAARRARETAGWRILEDVATGARIGIPGKLTPQHAGVGGGSRWSSARGEAQIEAFRISAPGTSLQAVYDAQRAVPERKVTYQLLRGDFFVISGTQGLKKLYVRAQARDGQVRGFSIMYDPAMEAALNHVVIAMSSAFQAFPAGVAAVPPPRRKVEYGTGVLVSPEGHAVTTRDLIDGCQTFNLAGYGPADLVAQDKDSGLALLRVYGVRDVKPVAIADSAAGADVTLVGVADPQLQGGGAKVSTSGVRMIAAGSDQRPGIEPMPALGFSGAAVIDRQGRLVGIADVRTQVLAGPPPTSGLQAALIPGATIRAFLGAQKVPANAGSGADAKDFVVRVICVRK